MIIRNLTIGNKVLLDNGMKKIIKSIVFLKGPPGTQDYYSILFRGDRWRSVYYESGQHSLNKELNISELLE